MILDDGSTLPTMTDIDWYNEIVKCTECEWRGTREEYNNLHHPATGH